MKKSLQAINDFYTRQGYRRERLRRILLKDREYQELLKERRQKLTQQITLTNAEKKKYVLSLDDDYEILSKVKQLEKRRLTKEEKFLIKFIRTQLEHDWRKWLLKELDKMMLKYKRLSRR